MKKDHVFSLVLIVTLVIGSYGPNAIGGTITIAEVEDCTDRMDGRSCEEKKVVGVSVSHGITKTLEFVTVSTNSSSGEPQTLEETVTVEISKSMPELHYPLDYFHTAFFYPARFHEDPKRSPLYFDGYEIRKYSEWFEVNIRITSGGNARTFTLSPHQPVHADNPNEAGPRFSAQLVGDLGSYKGAPHLRNHILYIPSNGLPYWDNMLLVPREEASRDGSECNKVGISPANRNCLFNQLYPKRNLDFIKMASNPAYDPTYLVSGMTDFQRSMKFQSGMKKRLVYKISEIRNSLVTLTTKADAVRDVHAESDGIIEEATVRPFDSLTRHGELQVTIANMGDLTADYIVTVTDPSPNVGEAIPAQARTVTPNGNTTLSFDVSTNHNSETTNALSVQLWSPTGRKYAETQVVFGTRIHPVAQFDTDEDEIPNISFGTDSDGDGWPDMDSALQQDIGDHSHIYLTGKRWWHNIREKKTGPPVP